MKKMEFLSLAEVNEIHGDQIDHYGGKAGTRDITVDRLIEVPFRTWGKLILDKFAKNPNRQSLVVRS